MKRVLITGAAGFIGSQLMARLKERDGLVVKGIDNFNKHLYSPSLKVARMKHFDLDIWGCDLCDEVKTEALIREFQPDTIVHLGLQWQVCAIRWVRKRVTTETTSTQHRT